MPTIDEMRLAASDLEDSLRQWEGSGYRDDRALQAAVVCHMKLAPVFKLLYGNVPLLVTNYPPYIIMRREREHLAQVVGALDGGLITQEHLDERFGDEGNEASSPTARQTNSVLPDVNRATLDRLLDLGSESEVLDYKSTFDPTDRRGVVEIAKDIGAMMRRGGHLVIGADSTGQIVERGGIDPQHRQQFDEANLRAKVGRYLGTDFEMHTALHDVNGVLVGVIHVVPNRRGFLAFSADGTYPDPRDPNRMQTSFREGDIYVRRGTASVRANQEEITRIIEEAATRLDSSE